MRTLVIALLLIHSGMLNQPHHKAYPIDAELHHDDLSTTNALRMQNKAYVG
jgi:hypothetical protein